MTYSKCNNLILLSLNIALAVFILCTVGCSSEKPGDPYAAPPSKTGKVTVKLSRPGRQHAGNHILAPAYINGHNAGYFIVDTGASLSVVNQTTVDHMKLKPTGQPPRIITGVGSRFQSEHNWLSPLQIGQKNFGDVAAVAIDIERFSNLKRVPVSGILGMDCIRRQPVTIDFKQKRLTFHDPHNFQPPAGIKPQRFKIARSGLIEIPVTLNGQYKAWLILDTGANTPISLPGSALIHWPKLLKNKINVQSQGSGVGSQFKVFRSKLDSINILGQTLRDVDLTIEQAIEKPDAHRVVIGRVGNFILENFVMTFDFSRQIIYAKWQPLN